MSKIEQIRNLLKDIGMPQKQQADVCCYSVQAMANVKPDEKWSDASNDWIRIHDIIEFTNNNYDVQYAENSREIFRKQAMHHFRNAALIEDNGLATNSPNYRYRLTDETLELIRALGSDSYSRALSYFLSTHERLIDKYASKKEMEKMPVRINSEEFTFSPGKHNELQKAIIEEFAPRFAPNSKCLYVGDTTVKNLVKAPEHMIHLNGDRFMGPRTE